MANITVNIVIRRKYYYDNIAISYKNSSKNKFCKFFTTLLFTSFSSTFSNPNSTFKEATALPRIPQGIILSKYPKLVFTFNAKRCIVTQREARTRIAHIFLAHDVPHTD